MDHFVTIGSLPDGFEFPPELNHRIHFDPVTGRLTFRGYMSKTDFDRLSQATTDWKFRRSLEELFRRCIPEEPARPRGFLSVVTRLFALG